MDTNTRIVRRLPLLILLLVLSGLISACNPLYVMRAAFEESKILLAREDIETVIANPDIDAADRNKLQLVLNARDFSKQLCLEPKESFTMYSATEDDVLAWVLMAAKKDAFALYSWWFPIVGSVPYKGFFDKADAQSLAQDLESQGYETSVRGTEAFSTLGWFNDPLMSTTLKRDPYQIVNTVIHEILHNSVWFKNHVAFNESLANFVGIQGAKEFFLSPHACSAGACTEESRLALQQISTIAESADYQLANTLEDLVKSLEELYASEKSYDEKLSERELIFKQKTELFVKRFPHIKAFAKLNNAELMQLRIYYMDLAQFKVFFECAQRDWCNFVSKIQSLQGHCEALDSQCDPFTLLSEAVQNCSPQAVQSTAKEGV